MSNHLHDLIDKLECNAPVFFEHMTEQQMDHVTAGAIKAGEQAICFYGGDIDDLANFKVIDELVRLPFDVCWIEMSSSVPGDHFVFGNMLWTFEGRVNGQAWRKHKSEWRYLFSWERSEDCTSLVAHFTPDMNQRSIQAQICYVYLFLTALNCTNVRRVEYRQPEKLQKARMKRGKKPLFSYWTLELNRDRAESAELGGTHSSPRLHLRRGHPRQYLPGKWTWVQPSVVGNKALGIVHKDYSIAE